MAAWRHQTIVIWKPLCRIFRVTEPPRDGVHRFKASIRVTHPQVVFWITWADATLAHRDETLQRTGRNGVAQPEHILAHATRANLRYKEGVSISARYCGPLWANDCT